MIECQTIRLDEMCKMSEVHIYYSFHKSPFGVCLIAFTEDKDKEKAVCHLAFADNNETEVLERLRTRYPGAQFIEEAKETKELIDNIFYKNNPKTITKIRVLLKGTDFQMKVWEALTTIPMGTLTTYEQVAQTIDKPKAVRAVASALKANQIGYLIPCHRVVCKSGCNKFSWGADRKVNMQDYEKNLLTDEGIHRQTSDKK